ncbi:putative 5-dehydro-4-deoxyglucarate dehydratase [Actinoplanes missouriensis 431]|uniref:Probable 5-dehydro-4-deoxyglucarate dehydratase n=1 Tax=Actinoplanes missouriensis (strain ATCC 14538 / DSM 43046 / CBS 188.64 / JCM 3121 / NBRC 102363 / NCIMB 12654 / NRRL B-3342 / UNCC 431) TaxID=512565 RepID=I0HDX0_ACTM4|nr:5-dehydro-4-deoxyglucarate dehydratase [Actinoplanes missouriensis]BAL91207.1 putative 5-dehydro-4-deoxyglucarate dehydratase [Actinoplanes missouriensis 431]
MTFHGVLFFPVTPFGADGGLDVSLLAEHVTRGVEAGAGAVFAGCGTGEFHALDRDEIQTVARTAVAATRNTVPVYAGAGGPLPVAVEQVRQLAEAGVDGVLLLPPYLVGGTQPGVVDYVRQVAAATDLPVVFYQRANAVLTPEAAAEVSRIPTVTGIKDGVGNLELMHRIVLAVRQASGPGFQFFNGLPTAEMTVPAYRGVGVPLYSSAVFAFAPEIALGFYRAVVTGDDTLRDELLERFYAPLVELRDARPGYPVALVKAGVRLRGLAVGGVRAPLTDPAPEHVDRLAELIEEGLKVVHA